MKYIFITIAILFHGCAHNTLIMTKEQQNTLKNKTITIVQYNDPQSPEIKTPGKALGNALLGGGILGAIIVNSLDTEDIKEERLYIPSEYISSSIMSFITKKYHMNYKKEERLEESLNGEIISSSDKEEVSELEKWKKHYTSDYILDIYNPKWMVRHRKMFGGAYVVLLDTNIRLIEREKQKIITQISCEYAPEYKEGLPSYDEMFANDSELMKTETRKASNLCIDKIKTQLFK